MATVDELVIEIKGDLGDITKKLRKLERNVTDTSSKVTRNFNNIARVAKLAIGAVVVQQVARAGAGLVKFASHVEEMQAKSSVVFGRFAKSVRSELGAFGDEVGRSVFELEEMASQIQDTFVPLGFARGEAAKLSVQMAKLATDVASFNNTSDVETIRRFQSALVGNHETVRRFGVIITEATISQELMRMGINKTSKEASNQEKVQARLNILMRGTTDAQGDAARTSESFANQMKGLGAALQNLGVAVMTPLLPKLAEFIGMIKAGIISVKEFLFNTGILTRDLTIQSEATKELVQAEAELFKARVAQEAFEAHTSGGAPDPGNRLKLAKERVKNINAQIRANEMLAKIQERQARIQDEHTKKMRARGEAEDIINNAIKTAQEETAQLTLLVKAKTEAERAGITSTLEFSEAFATLGEEGEI